MFLLPEATALAARNIWIWGLRGKFGNRMEGLCAEKKIWISCGTLL
jgi:hypothetical protein